MLRSVDPRGVEFLADGDEFESCAHAAQLPQIGAAESMASGPDDEEEDDEEDEDWDDEDDEEFDDDFDDDLDDDDADDDEEE